jgi:hypothetical protein
MGMQVVDAEQRTPSLVQVRRQVGAVAWWRTCW